MRDFDKYYWEQCSNKRIEYSIDTWREEAIGEKRNSEMDIYE
jgi:hypothetical protein